jgi:dihydrofolate reductase
VKTVYYTGSSLDGYLVDAEGSLDWLISRTIDADGPFGYDGFIKTVGALAMGADTYEWIVKNNGEWSYEQPAWVLTHRPDIASVDHPVQTFAGDVSELHPKLVTAAAGKDVWVIGGGHVAAQFVAAGLVDELVVSYAPCTLGAGSPVLPLRSEWVLESSAVNGDFVCARWTKA